MSRRRAVLPTAAAAAVALAALLALASCGPAPRAPGVAAGDLHVEPGRATLTPGGDVGAAYFIVRNQGADPDTLREVRVAGATDAVIHTYVRAEGMMRMVPLDPVVVGARDSLVLQPGGAHLMFRRSGGTWPADSLRITLSFARAGSLAVALPVRPIGQETR